MGPRRPIFYISDGTGITAETIGHSVLTQFEGVAFDTRRLPFVDNEEKVRSAVEQVRAAEQLAGARAIVINTVVDPELSAILAESGALMLDVFAPFIVPLEQELGQKRSPKVGKAHGLNNYTEYEGRMNATNYALTHDDGVDINFSDAEVILLGVSRSGKTPTCLYMALHYGVRAANYPLTPDDLDKGEIPAKVKTFKKRIFGLTIDPNRLTQIRAERKPGSRYASLEQCKHELAEAEKLLKREGIPMLSTTHTSIEEIASKVMQSLGLNRQMF
jgi:[pyruvate, water dikinase]-phosphate phosphotransferase / [pyruvate, water dikinase] kinase